MVATKKFDCYIVELRHGDEIVSSLTVEYRKFKEVKKLAIEMLKKRLEASYGRGEHSVNIYGAVLMNVTSPEKMEVGFGIQWEWVGVEEVFSL